MANYFQPLANGAELDFRISYSYTDDFYNNALMTEAIKTDS